MTEPPELISPNEAGHWDGDVFTFDPPIVRGDRVLRHVDCSLMELPDDITRDDVISALLNPVYITEIQEDDMPNI
jgi:hypothetical protein